MKSQNPQGRHIAKMGDDLHRSLERLVALGKTPDVNIRPVLLRVMVDFFLQKPHHSHVELAQFQEIALLLFEEADNETRLIVAERLSACSLTPGVLIERFLVEGGSVASAVLARARLDHQVLLAAASLGTPDMATAVARRADLDVELSSILAQRPERDIVLAIAGNAHAPLGRPLFQHLVRRARGDDELSRLLLARPGEPADLSPLFLLASVEQRAAIMLAALRDDLGPETRQPRLNEEQASALSRLERSLLSHDQDSFDVALAAALQVSLAEAWGIIDDPHGEPLAIALAALGASPELAARVFILSGPAIGHSVMTVRNLITIVGSLSMRSANRLLAAITSTPVGPARSKAVREPDTRSPRHRPTSEARPLEAPLAPFRRQVLRSRSSR